MSKFQVLSAVVASLFATALGAEQSTDSLSAERMTAIAVAYDRTTSTPSDHVDALSPYVTFKIEAAFSTLDQAPQTDVLEQSQWEVLRAAYNSHDAARTSKPAYIGN